MSRTGLYLLHGKFASSRQLFLAFVFILRVYLVGEGGGKKTKRLVNAFIKLILTEFMRFLLICVYINMISR